MRNGARAVTLPALGEIPSDVLDMLREYWSRRDTQRWTMATKQNPAPPLKRLCGELREARVAVENYRNELVRANAIRLTSEKVTSVEPLRENLGRLLADLLVTRFDDAQPKDDGRWLIELWKTTQVRIWLMRYAHLGLDWPLNNISMANIEELMQDVGKLSSIAVGLADAEDSAQRIIPSIGHDRSAEAVLGKDRATTWLLHHWREHFPNVSRRALVRWICRLGIEPGEPAEVEGRLRKAEGRRQGARRGSKEKRAPPTGHSADQVKVSPGRRKKQ